MTSKTAFISHASGDSDVARKICQMLESRGISCWIAPRDIAAGKDYGEEIIYAIENSAVTILVLSDQANKSIFVPKEVERAVSKGKPVFPVRIRNVLPSTGLELFISSSHWVDAWQPPMEIKMDQLAGSIHHLIESHTGTKVHPEAPPGNLDATSGEPASVEPVAKVCPSPEEKLLIRNYFRFHDVFERTSSEAQVAAGQCDEFNTHIRSELSSHFETFDGFLVEKKNGHESYIVDSLSIPNCWRNKESLWTENWFLDGLVLERSQYWADGVEDWIVSLRVSDDAADLLLPSETRQQAVLIISMARFCSDSAVCYCLQYFGWKVEVYLADSTRQECTFELPAISPRPFVFGNPTYILFTSEISSRQLVEPGVVPLDINEHAIEPFLGELKRLNLVLKHDKLHLETRIGETFRIVSTAVHQLCETLPKGSQVALDERELLGKIGLAFESTADDTLLKFVCLAVKIAFWREGVSIIGTDWAELGGGDYYRYSPDKMEISLAIAELMPADVINGMKRESSLKVGVKGGIALLIKGRLDLSEAVPWLLEIVEQGQKETRNGLEDAIWGDLM